MDAPPPASSDIGSLVPVSLDDPTLDEAEALALCDVAANADIVTGMARLDHATDVPKYAPLTGREPEIATSAPAWVVRYDGTVTLQTRSRAGIISATDPTCVVVDGTRYWMLTGSWSDAEGEHAAESVPPPAHSLPPLQH